MTRTWDVRLGALALLLLRVERWAAGMVARAAAGALLAGQRWLVAGARLLEVRAIRIAESARPASARRAAPRAPEVWLTRGTAVRTWWCGATLRGRRVRGTLCDAPTPEAAARCVLARFGGDAAETVRLTVCSRSGPKQRAEYWGAQLRRLRRGGP